MLQDEARKLEEEARGWDKTPKHGQHRGQWRMYGFDLLKQQ